MSIVIDGKWHHFTIEMGKKTHIYLNDARGNVYVIFLKISYLMHFFGCWFIQIIYNSIYVIYSFS